MLDLLNFLVVQIQQLFFFILLFGILKQNMAGESGATSVKVNGLTSSSINFSRYFM